MSRSRVVMCVAAALVIGWVANDVLTQPQQKKRPILNFIKNWWWVPLLLDEPQKPVSLDTLKREIGADGFAVLRHGDAL